MSDGTLIDASRRFEQRAYRSADRVVVISDSFQENLAEKGVPDEKIERIYNPASRPVRRGPPLVGRARPRAVLHMGNVGRTQNLTSVAQAFRRTPALAQMGATLTLTGDGVAAGEVRESIKTDRVSVDGLVARDRLDELIASAAVGLVSQSYDAIDFNVPSKLMNFMAYVASRWSPPSGPTRKSRG